MEGAADGMRTYWDERARENAAWYVDTTCDYDHPDMDKFFEDGQRIVQVALLEAPIQPAKRGLAVELGPGLGRICRALAEHFDRVVGVDVSQEMVQKARSLVDDPKVSFEVGDGTGLGPVATGSADFVVTFTVLQHMPSAELIEGNLRDAARVLAPGGVLAAQWNNTPHDRLWKLRVLWWRVRNRLGGRFATDVRSQPQFAGTRLAMDRLTRTLEGAGMTVRGSTGLDTLFAWVWAEKTSV
jgi:SAM-dependent methyltransferase